MESNHLVCALKGRSYRPLLRLLTNLLEEVDLHTPKPPKWHIKHELNAHLSTSTLADSSPLVSSKRWFLISCPPQPYVEFTILTVSMTVQRYEKNLKLPNNLTHFNNFLYLTFYISHHISHVCHNGSIENWMAHLNLVKTIPKCFSVFISKPNVHKSFTRMQRKSALQPQEL